MPDCIFIFKCRCGFQNKMIHAALFYFHGEPIFYFQCKLRNIEWKGLKKKAIYRNCSFASTAWVPLPIAACLLVQTAWLCVAEGQHHYRNERVGCHSRCATTEVSLLHVFVDRVENALDYEEFCPVRSAIDQGPPGCRLTKCCVWTSVHCVAFIFSRSPGSSRLQEPSLTDMQPVLGGHL